MIDRISRRLGAAALAWGLMLCATPALAAPETQPARPYPPPPVDGSLLPTPEQAATMPYLMQGQTGLPDRVAACIGPYAGRLDPTDVPRAQERLGIGRLRGMGTGAGQRIAVIDSGVSPHPRLAGRLSDGGDYLLGDTGLSDCEGHGTLVAGIIGAAPDPATGFQGVAPDAAIISIRQSSTYFTVEVPDPYGDGTVTVPAGDTSGMARAVVRAVESGATIINISEAACYPATSPGDAPDRDLQAAIRLAASRNVVVVVAAANKSELCRQNAAGSYPLTISSPGWFDDDVLTVAATTASSDDAAPFSLHGPWVDVAAPGTGIVSLDPAGPGLTDVLVPPGQEPIAVQGTSFAVPYVTGLVALIRERFPDLDARQVMARIEYTAKHPAVPGGWNEAVGFGPVDPLAALTRAVPGQPGGAPTPVAPQAESSSDSGDSGVLTLVLVIAVGMLVVTGVTTVVLRRRTH